jgi:hypothetical protein
MVVAVAALIIGLAFMSFGVWLGLRLSRKLGYRSPREWDARTRRRLGIAILVEVLVLGGIIVAFASGKPAIGIGIAVIAFVTPMFLTTPARMRKGR